MLPVTIGIACYRYGIQHRPHKGDDTCKTKVKSRGRISTTREVVAEGEMVFVVDDKCMELEVDSFESAERRRSGFISHLVDDKFESRQRAEASLGVDEG